jgi:hypothetical protein
MHLSDLHSLRKRVSKTFSSHEIGIDLNWNKFQDWNYLDLYSEDSDIDLEEERKRKKRRKKSRKFYS